jgi:hypothetical protein
MDKISHNLVTLAWAQSTMPSFGAVNNATIFKFNLRSRTFCKHIRQFHVMTEFLLLQGDQTCLDFIAKMACPIKGYLHDK